MQGRPDHAALPSAELLPDLTDSDGQFPFHSHICAESRQRVPSVTNSLTDAYYLCDEKATRNATPLFLLRAREIHIYEAVERTEPHLATGRSAFCVRHFPPLLVAYTSVRLSDELSAGCHRYSTGAIFISTRSPFYLDSFLPALRPCRFCLGNKPCPPGHLARLSGLYLLRYSSRCDFVSKHLERHQVAWPFVLAQGTIALLAAQHVAKHRHVQSARRDTGVRAEACHC